MLPLTLFPPVLQFTRKTPSSSASPRRLQLLGVIFGLLRITPSPLLISLIAYQGLIACEL